MSTVQTAVDEFNQTYADVDPTGALALFNEIDEEILTYLPWRKQQYDVPLVASQIEFEIPETIVKIWSCRLLQSSTNQIDLEETSVDALDLNPFVSDGPAWRNTAPSTPQKYFANADITSGTVGIWPTSKYSTLLVSGATNANPTVLTVTAHGLSTGDTVNIAGVLGNTAANNPNLVGSTWSITVLDANTFSIPVAGNGGYVSGGLVVATNSPKLTLDVTIRVPYALNDSLPLLPQIRWLYVNGMKMLYSSRRDLEKYPAWKKLYDADKATQVGIITERTARLKPKIQLVRQRPYGYVQGRRRNCAR